MYGEAESAMHFVGKKSRTRKIRRWKRYEFVVFGEIKELQVGKFLGFFGQGAFYGLIFQKKKINPENPILTILSFWLRNFPIQSPKPSTQLHPPDKIHSKKSLFNINKSQTFCGLNKRKTINVLVLFVKIYGQLLTLHIYGRIVKPLHFSLFPNLPIVLFSCFYVKRFHIVYGIFCFEINCCLFGDDELAWSMFWRSINFRCCSTLLLLMLLTLTLWYWE